MNPAIINQFEQSNNNSINLLEKDKCVTEDSYLSKLPNPSHVKIQDVIDECETEALSHQIAGHSRTGVLKHKLGFVLKPVQDPPLGEREVKFYEQVFSRENTDHQILQGLVPCYHGITNVASVINGVTVCREYLILDDAVQGFNLPCIVDVKIGAKTWDPLATLAKIEHEKQKYAGTKSQLGLSITGMQHYDLLKGRVVKQCKDYGKYLSTTTIHTTWEEFFNVKAGAHKAILPIVLARLQSIKNLFSTQREFAFYSSSILLAYDASKFQTDASVGTGGGHSASVDANDVCVKMIDFAHVFPGENTLDHNYLFGLDNLIRMLESLNEKDFSL